MQVLYARSQLPRRCLCVALVIVFIVSAAGRLLAQVGAEGSVGGWSVPNTISMHRSGPLSTVQNRPNFLENLDCTLITYRLVDSSNMQHGCFTATAFGMLDSDSDVAIFNGTDEGLPLAASSAHQSLVPWPNALNLMTLDASMYGGSYLGMYKNPLPLLQDQRNSYGQLTGKQLTAPPEVIFREPSGQRLRINPSTMSFSSGGSWLVAETMNSSFVRINLATLNMTAFAQSFIAEGIAGSSKSQVAVSDNGRFIAIANTSSSSLRVYDLSTCDGMVNGLHPQSCHSYEYWPSVSKQIDNLRLLRHLKFINDRLLSFEAVSSDAAHSGSYILSPSANITSLTDYIGVGDSYTSGEGVFDYLAGTDTDKSTCHLSINSYPLLLTRDVFSAAGGHSVACSGAVIEDITSESGGYQGQVKGSSNYSELVQSDAVDSIMANFSPGYIAQHRFLQHYQPRVTTVSIGGNDIGFGAILQKCVMPHVSIHPGGSDCYHTYESRAEVAQLIDRTVPRWISLYRQLQAENPDGRLYVIGYPSISSDTGSCSLNVHLSQGEREFAEELIRYLNSSIERAAAAANISYVDIDQALVGHRLCEAAGYDVAVNGLTAGNDAGLFGINVIGRESYHPNALGHELIEQAILKQTKNFSSTEVTLPSVTASNLLDAPRSGVTINHLVLSEHLTANLLHAGNNATIQVSGLRAGLRANASYMIRMDGPAGSVLTTTNTSETDDLVTNVSIPASTAPGSHTIDVTGNDQAGNPIDITQSVYITGDGDDADNDGVANNKDLCRMP